MSQRSSSTEAGDVNRKAERERGRMENSGTSAEFGQKIGRSENLSEEGGEMRNNRDRQDNDLKNTNLGSESTRRSGSESGYGSSSRRSGSLGEGDSEISRDEKSPSRSGSGSVGNTGSSEGRH